MSDSPNKAVFLSYASQDADAARRICEALRTAGIEVWFDQSELRGGDAWDAKIRKQIKECALFVPIISANTQARTEGYFRLEWRLADQRTHLMSHDRAFLLPVTIDATNEQNARVPDSFLAVQWTRLTDDEGSRAFGETVRKLLEPSRQLESKLAPRGANRFPPDETNRPQVGRAFRARPVWPFAMALGMFLIGLVWVFLRSKPGLETTPQAAAQRSTPPIAEKAPPLASAKSIAVLPFENVSPDPANEFFADGMHDEVITSLVKIRDLKVISRASVMAYRKIEGRNLKAIAAELGVANVLEGRVRRSGNQVKVTVELIDGTTGQLLWAAPYTKDLTDAFAIQAELATAITSALKATLSPEEKTLLARRPTENEEAYDLYLRARALGDTQGDVRSRATVERVIDLYEQATRKDADFALAHVQLCFAHGILYWFGNLDPTPARKARAKAARDAAVRISPDAPETHLAAGLYAYLCQNDWAGALAEFRTASAGLPNDPQVVAYTGFALRRLGRLAEAVPYLSRAVELNPREVSTPSNETGTLLALRRYAASRDLAERYWRMHPTDSSIVLNLISARFALDGDVANFLRGREAAPPSSSDEHGLEKAYVVALLRGQLAEADRILSDSRLKSIDNVNGVIREPVSLHRALVAFLQGEQDKARGFAETALTQLQSQEWNSRQKPQAMVTTAMAHALAGHAELAANLARAFQHSGIRSLEFT